MHQGTSWGAARLRRSLRDSGFIDYDYLVRTPGISEPEPNLIDPEAVEANLSREPDANTDAVNDPLSIRVGFVPCGWGWPGRTGGLAGEGHRGDRATTVQRPRGAATCGSTRATSARAPTDDSPSRRWATPRRR